MPGAKLRRRRELMKRVDIERALSSMPMPVTLIGSSWEGSDNVMTASWVTVSSRQPPLVSIFINKKHLTSRFISQSREFVLNVLASDQVEVSETCGTVSGRKVDKYAKASLKTRPADQVSVPLVEGCLANLECRVVADYEVGDHNLFVGEIVAAHEGDRWEPLARFDSRYADILFKSEA
jgi:flavin reductase (DIM6/NTAB) family NADH-FMN oxidoreductase RutF